MTAHLLVADGLQLRVVVKTSCRALQLGGGELEVDVGGSSVLVSGAALVNQSAQLQLCERTTIHSTPLLTPHQDTQSRYVILFRRRKIDWRCFG
jgi:hypothetical protein